MVKTRRAHPGGRPVATHAVVRAAVEREGKTCALAMRDTTTGLAFTLECAPAALAALGANMRSATEQEEFSSDFEIRGELTILEKTP